jgi:hypothetical protein
VQEYKDQVLREGNVGTRVSKDNRNLSCNLHKPTKKLGRSKIDTLETADDVVLIGNIFLHPGAPH